MTPYPTVAECEAQLLLADASPEPDTSVILDRLLADDVLMIGPDGRLVAKSFILDAHRPPRKQPFISVTVNDQDFRDLGETTIVTALTEYRTPAQVFTLRFLRVWRRNANGWQVVAGSITALAAA